MITTTLTSWKSLPQRYLKRRSREAFSENGFTLIESLVAIVVVSALLTGIAPMVAVSVATRVQARRVDLATQAARAYIDGVRGGTVPIPQKFAILSQDRITDANFPAPTPVAASYPTDTQRDAGTLVDTNNNGFSVSDPQDLIIQPLRNNGLDATIPMPQAEIGLLNRKGYELVVRVYRADAFGGFGTGAPTQVTETKSIFTSTNGSRNYPLVVMKARIFPSGSTLLNIAPAIPAP